MPIQSPVAAASLLDHPDLSPNEREIMRLEYIEQLPPWAVAAVLGITERHERRLRAAALEILQRDRQDMRSEVVKRLGRFRPMITLQEGHESRDALDWTLSQTAYLLDDPEASAHYLDSGMSPDQVRAWREAHWFAESERQPEPKAVPRKKKQKKAALRRKDGTIR